MMRRHFSPPSLMFCFYSLPKKGKGKEVAPSALHGTTAGASLVYVQLISSPFALKAGHDVTEEGIVGPYARPAGNCGP